MISTLYGHLPLVLYPQSELPVTTGARAQICRIRGEVFPGFHINAQVTLDANTGELLIMTPDGMVGAVRLGDVVVAHVQQQLARSATERLQQQEGTHAPTH